MLRGAVVIKPLQPLHVDLSARQEIGAWQNSDTVLQSHAMLTARHQDSIEGFVQIVCRVAAPLQPSVGIMKLILDLCEECARMRLAFSSSTYNTFKAAHDRLAGHHLLHQL